jgi:hypothetical protein
MQRYHSVVDDLNMSALTRVLKKTKTVPELLSAAADWVQRMGVLDPTMPPEMIEALKVQDLKVQIGIRLVGASQMARLLRQQEQQNLIDQIVKEKLTKRYLRKLSPDDAVSLQNATTRNMATSFEILERVGRLSKADMADTIDKLVDTIRTILSQQNSLPIRIAGPPLPSDPHKRTEFIRLMKSIDLDEVQVYDEFEPPDKEPPHEEVKKST